MSVQQQSQEAIADPSPFLPSLVINIGILERIRPDARPSLLAYKLVHTGHNVKNRPVITLFAEP
jgi:hypothetical protein